MSMGVLSVREIYSLQRESQPFANCIVAHGTVIDDRGPISAQATNEKYSRILSSDSTSTSTGQTPVTVRIRITTFVRMVGLRLVFHYG